MFCILQILLFTDLLPSTNAIFILVTNGFNIIEVSLSAKTFSIASKKRDYFSHVLKEKLMMIRKRANQGMILNLDGMDGMRISNVTYCKLNKRLKTMHFFERKKNNSKTKISRVEKFQKINNRTIIRNLRVVKGFILHI